MVQFASHRMGALMLWCIAIVMTFALSSWRMHDVHVRAEKALAARAEQVAKQLSNLLSIVGWNLDITVARPIVFTTMRDPQLYAVKVLSHEGVLEGQRRNAKGGLEPWDGQLIEKTVQAISTISLNEEKIGTVEVYLRVSETAEYVHEAFIQEIICFFLNFSFFSFCLLLYLFKCGYFPIIKKNIVNLFKKISNKRSKNEKKHFKRDGLEKFLHKVHAVCDLEQGAKYYQLQPEAMYVTAELFKQTFANVPMILARLHTEKNFNDLLYIARLIEVAAPCIGAYTLQEEAIKIQETHNGRDSFESNLSVESCINILEQVLNELAYNKKNA